MPLEPTRIVVGVDGSPPSFHAAREAFSLAERLHGEVTLVLSLEPPQVLAVGPAGAYLTLSEGTPPGAAAAAKAALETLAAERPTVPTTVRVESGAAADVLCAVAGTLGADLLVVGARGQNPAQRLLLGSVSDRVVRHAPCPVLVVRRGGPPSPVQP